MGVPGKIIDAGNSVYLYGTAGDDSFSGSYKDEYFYTGLGDDIVFAGDGKDYVFADFGDDWLNGGTGIDTLTFLQVNSGGTGSNLVAADQGVIVDLTKTKQDLGYFGVKTIYNFENVEGTYEADRISGDGNANTLYAAAGNDRLDGRGGNDLLSGGLGADTITGGTGADHLLGYYELAVDNARDTFIYKSIKESGTKESTRDHIFGTFDGKGSDKIDLSAIDANGSAKGNGAFTFIGQNDFHKNAVSEVQIRATGYDDEYLVSIDIDTDNKPEMTIVVHSTSILTASDFIL